MDAGPRDVVRPQPGPPPGAGCLRGAALLLLAVALAALAVAAGGCALLSVELGGVDGPLYALLCAAVAAVLTGCCVAVLGRLARCG